MSNIGFTGTRDGMTIEQRKKFLSLIKKLRTEQFHHGDCIGSDKQANEMIDSNRDPYEKIPLIISHPPKYNGYRANCKADVVLKPEDYLTRNRDIVNATEVLIATPQGKEKLRSGTWSTIRYARTKKRKIYIIFPDGKVKEEGKKNGKKSR